MKGRNKLIIIIGAILIAVATVMFFVGGALSGWDIRGMFLGKSAIWSYIIIGTAIIFLAFVFISDKIKKM